MRRCGELMRKWLGGALRSHTPRFQARATNRYPIQIILAVMHDLVPRKRNDLGSISIPHPQEITPCRQTRHGNARDAGSMLEKFTAIDHRSLEVENLGGNSLGRRLGDANQYEVIYDNRLRMACLFGVDAGAKKHNWV